MDPMTSSSTPISGTVGTTTGETSLKSGSEPAKQTALQNKTIEVAKGKGIIPNNSDNSSTLSLTTSHNDVQKNTPNALKKTYQEQRIANDKQRFLKGLNAKIDKAIEGANQADSDQLSPAFTALTTLASSINVSRSSEELAAFNRLIEKATEVASKISDPSLKVESFSKISELLADKAILQNNNYDFYALIDKAIENIDNISSCASTGNSSAAAQGISSYIRGKLDKWSNKNLSNSEMVSNIYAKWKNF